MTEREACRILGVPEGARQSVVKKKYRQLILRVHPDIDRESGASYLDEAKRINQAYEILKRKRPVTDDQESFEKRKEAGGKKRENGGDGGTAESGRYDRADEKKQSRWNAPVNVHAYCEREIYCNAEDMDGTAIGNFCIAKGKYLWTMDEEFSLFLLSLYRCSRRLLDETDTELYRNEDTERKQKAQTELTYLLAQQFTDAGTLLKEIVSVKKDTNGRDVFKLSAMLELDLRAPMQEPGALLYPSAVKKHRLYLKNRDGQELGYLSFPDDRLYYLVVPLFEQRRVQVRIRVRENRPEKKRRTANRYQNLCIWLRLSGESEVRMPENLNLQIRQLLREYREREVHNMKKDLNI